MVLRLWQLLHKEWSGLHQAAFLLAGASLVSQLLGLVRDRLLAGTFGAGSELDIYYTAFRIPDLVYVSIASFVSVTVLIPFISRASHLEDRAALRDFLGAIVTVFTVVMLGALVVLWVLMPYLAPFIAPGFAPAAQNELIFLSRLLLLSPLLLGVSNLLGGVTQSFHKFFAFTVSPIIYNLGIIGGIIFLYPTFGLPGIVFGVILGALGHLAIQVPSVYRLGLLPTLSLAIPWRTIGKIVASSLPRTITLAMHQVVVLALVALASTITAGGVAIFTLAQNLQTVPIMIVGVSYSVAAFPTLAKLVAAGQRDVFIEKIVVAARHITFWSMPAVVFIIVLRAHIVRVVFGAGEFSWTDTRLTAAALALLVLCAGAYSLSQLLIRGYYAVGNTMKPLLINLGTSVAIVVGSWWLLGWFRSHMESLYFLENLLRVDDVPGSLVLTLPLAFSVGMIINALIFVWVFEYDFGGLVKPLARSTTENLVASVAGGAVAYGILLLGSPIFDLSTLGSVLGQGVAAGGVGMAAWLVTLALLGNEEFRESLTAVRVRFAPKQSIVTEQEEL